MVIMIMMVTGVSCKTCRLFYSKMVGLDDYDDDVDA